MPVLLWLVLLLPGVAIANSTLELNVQDNRIDMLARNVDVKTILLRLRNETKISVRCPTTIAKKVTLDLVDVALDAGLKRILKGLNYATIYNRPAGEDRARVTEIHVLKPYHGSLRSTRFSRRQHRLDNRIQNYQKRIQHVQHQLTRVDDDSPAGKRYQRMIRRYQAIIERLQRQSR
jgi:hypothetical protein